MSPNGLEIEVEEQGFPRVSGDEPYQTVTLAKRVAFSPRERG